MAHTMELRRKVSHQSQLHHLQQLRNLATSVHMELGWRGQVLIRDLLSAPQGSSQVQQAMRSSNRHTSSCSNSNRETLLRFSTSKAWHSHSSSSSRRRRPPTTCISDHIRLHLRQQAPANQRLESAQRRCLDQISRSTPNLQCITPAHRNG